MKLRQCTVDGDSPIPYSMHRKVFIKFAFMGISGIITTNLGKNATNTKSAGRERRVHHSKSMPLSLIGEGLFFMLIYRLFLFINYFIIQVDTSFYRFRAVCIVSESQSGLPPYFHDMAQDS